VEDADERELVTTNGSKGDDKSPNKPKRRTRPMNPSLT